MTGSVLFNRIRDQDTYMLQFRLRPEIYGPHKDNYTLSSSFTAQYQRRWSSFDFNVGGTIRKQYYSVYSDRLDVDMAQVFSSVAWRLMKNISGEIEGRYNKASIDADVQNTVSSVSVSPRALISFSKYAIISAGSLFEHYSATTNDTLFIDRSIKGWRLGPELNFEYTKNLLVNIHYLPSRRYTKRSSASHTEHEIHMVAGKNLNAKWSVFILADYYIRDVDSASNVFFYTQTNYENRINVKLAYSWKGDYSVYFKLVYLNNELIREKSNLSGTQAILGFEIQK